MKMNHVFIKITALASFCALLIVGCGKKETKPTSSAKSTLVSVEKNSFYETTAYLDPGGSFYMYMGTEKVLNGLSEIISSWRDFVLSIPNIEDKDKITKAFDFVTRLVKKSGVEEISGIGISSIAREKDLYYSKAILHHYQGRNSGGLWSFFGKTPHALDGLDLLPSTTAMAYFSDLDLHKIWMILQKELSDLGIPEIEQGLRKFPEELEQMAGIKLEPFLASLGGEFGVVVTLDESKKVSIPLPTGQTLEVPDPGIMLVVKVKDDTIFNHIDQLLKSNPMTINADKDGVKMRTMPLPLPLPIQVRPTVARSGDYLFIASTDALIQEALAVKSGQKKGMKSTDEFKKLSQGVPQEGNVFQYFSKTLGKTMSNIQKNAMKMSQKGEATENVIAEKLMQQGGSNFGYAVFGNTDEGWLGIGNSNQDSSKALLAATTIAPIGLLSAVAVPSFIRARLRSQATTTLNELRMLDAAKDQISMGGDFMIKNGETIPNWSDLTPNLKPGSRLTNSNGNDLLGNPFQIGNFKTSPKVNPVTKEHFKEATGGSTQTDAFWGPYS